MAVTKLWSVTERLGQVIDYATNPEKTSAKIKREFSLEQYQALADVIAYAKDEEKTERIFLGRCYHGGQHRSYMYHFVFLDACRSRKDGYTEPVCAAQCGTPFRDRPIWARCPEPNHGGVSLGSAGRRVLGHRGRAGGQHYWRIGGHAQRRGARSYYAVY